MKFKNMTNSETSEQHRPKNVSLQTCLHVEKCKATMQKGQTQNNNLHVEW